jgi:uncharacterized protein (DUF4415 family)
MLNVEPDRMVAARAAAREQLARMTDHEDREITEAALTDPDNPPLGNDRLARMRPVSEVTPELLDFVKRARRSRGPGRAPRKELVSVRFSPEVLAHFRASGEGWQTRMDTALKEWIREHPNS